MTPEYRKQIAECEKLYAEKGRKALNNPHGMIGKTCGCRDCFCCAAYHVLEAAAIREYQIRSLRK